MVDHCAREFKRKWNKDLTGNQRALGRLRSACEKAKKVLSCISQTSIELDCLHEGIECSIKLSRAKFEKLNMDSFNKCIEILEMCLSDAKMKRSSIDQVILVGGSSRIPKVQCMLQEYFDGKELCKSVNPDEAVAYGAAIKAANLSGYSNKSVQDLVLLDITPLSLGVQTLGKVFTVVIPRNTQIPTCKSIKLITTTDNQSSMKIMVYQGERSKSTDNNLLESFSISGKPLAHKGVSKVLVSFEIDANNILTVTASIVSTGMMKKLTITNTNGRLSKGDIEKMVKDAQKYKHEDEEYKKKADAQNALEDCLYKMKNKINEVSFLRMVIPGIWKEAGKAIADTTKWLEENQAAPFAEIQLKKEHLDFVYKQI